MRKLQSQGVHHITIVGAGRQVSIDFWEGLSLSDDRSPKHPYQREVGPGHGPGHGLG